MMQLHLKPKPFFSYPAKNAVAIVFFLSVCLLLTTFATVKAAGNADKKLYESNSLFMDIVGVVVDQFDIPIPQASVIVKGTNVGTATNASGEFALTNVNPGAVLVISATGFKEQEVKLTSTETTLFIKLASTIKELDEVVTTGYQKLDRKLFTGAANVLNAKDAQRNGVPDVSRMLEARVAGVSVQNVSGTFGAAPKIRIRGATSISGENKPLWVVDGIILEDIVNISNEQLTTGDPSTLIGSSVAGLNPEDIESFTILKDAAATAQFGARAMNGVVIINTKKGVNTGGAAQVTYNTNLTTYLKPRYETFDILNSADQMALFIELENKGYFSHAGSSRGREGGIFYKMYNTMYDYDPVTDQFALKNDVDSRINFLNRYAKVNTDWFDILFNNSLLQEHSFSVLSGTEKSKFYASTSYLQDNGWTIADKVKRFTGNFKANFTISPRVSFELGATGSIRQQTTPGTIDRESDPVRGGYNRGFDINPFSYSLNTSRTITTMDEAGNREYFLKNWAPFNILNELENNTLDLNMVDFKINTNIKIKILKNLNYSFDGSFRFAKSDIEHKANEKSNMALSYRSAFDATVRGTNEYLYSNPDFPNDLRQIVLPEGGFYKTRFEGINNYYMRNSLEYDNRIDDNNRFNLYANAELRYTDRLKRTVNGVGYQFDNGGIPYIDYRMIKWLVERGEPYFTAQPNYDRFLAYSARAAYSFRDRYSLNATFRYDGSNLMGDEPTARWLPTWNISGAWDIDQEAFFPTSGPLYSLRLRGTYGLVGSLGQANNSSLLLRNALTRRRVLAINENTIEIAALKNSELTWEKLYEANIGVDIGLFEKNVTLTIDVYKRDIFDLIGPIRTSGIGGEFSKYTNYGKMKSKGIEFTFNATPFKKDQFTWTTNLNLGINKSEITELDNDPNVWSLINQNGGPQLGYPSRGLFSIKFSDLSREEGVPYFLNEKAQRSVNVFYQSTTGLANIIYNGPIDATLTGGFYNSLTYGNINLSTLVSFSQGNVIRLDPGFTQNPTDMYAMTKDYLNRWVLTGDNINTTIPATIDQVSIDRLLGQGGTPFNAFNYSDQRVAKGDFIRLKQIAIRYQLPRKLVSKTSLKTISVSLVGNNIALLYSDSRLNGADPEFFGSGGVAVPIPSQYTFNLKIGL